MVWEDKELKERKKEKNKEGWWGNKKKMIV